MNKKEIKKQIVESLLEEKELISSLMDQIQQDEELASYYEDMKILLSNKSDEEIDPGDSYFESAWQEIESKIEQQADIIPFHKRAWIRSIAAAILIGFSFYLGTQIQSAPLTNETEVIAQKSNSENRTKLKTLFRKYNVTLTSFVNMDEFESHDLLKVIIRSSEQLLDDTRELKRAYRENEDVYEILSGLERILIAISHLKDKSISNVRVMQFQLQNKINIDEPIRTQI